MRLDWRGKPLRRDAMTLEQALAMADGMKATRLARGGKHGEPHYDVHRALERLAKAVRAASLPHAEILTMAEGAHDLKSFCRELTAARFHHLRAAR